MFNFNLQRFANIKTVKDGAVAEGLPPATSSTKGGVVVGTGLSVDSQGKISVPTATTTSNGLMTSTEKTKLSSIASGAEVNVINTVKVNNSSLTVSDKAVNIDLTGYVQKDGSKVLSTNDYTTADKNKLAGIATGAEVNKIETIKVNGTALTPDSNRVVEITTTSVDISNKVDKVEGKGLSTNDYTTEEKNKLAGIASNANNYSLPNATTTTKGGVIIGTGLSVSNSTLSVATATTGTIGGIKLGNGVTTTTGGVVSIRSATASQDGLMTSTQASKLAGIATGAEVNVINTVKVNNTALSVSSKAVNIDLTDYVKQHSEPTFYGIDITEGDISIRNQNLVFTGGTANESIIFDDNSAIDANNYTGNAATATKLKTGRTLKVSLNSTSASTAFDGTANITNIGVAGTLPVANGGTGATTAATARTNLGLGTLSTLSSVALGSNVTGTLGTANGGTGTNNLANVTVGKASSLATPQSIVASLGSSVAASFNGSAAVTVGTQGTLPVNKGGTGLTASPSMLTNLGSTTAANVLAATPRPGITGTLGVANGGTGLTSSPSMLTNLGSTVAANILAASPRPGVTGTLPIANGGTGATTAANARASLGLGAVATQNTLAVANGGTGTNNLANITVGAATKDGSGHTITSYYAPLASPTFTGEVTAPTIKGLNELQFHYHVNTTATGAFTFTGVKTFHDHGDSTGKSMMVTAGQALLLGSGEAVANAMRLNGTADSITGLTAEYITGESTAIVSDNQISFLTNAGDSSNTKQWIFGANGQTTMPGRVTSERYLLQGGWLGKPANDPITVSYTNGGSTSTMETSNDSNILLVGNNRLFLIAGEGGTYKFAKYSDKITCRDYTLGRVPIWIMPQGSAIDLSEPEDSTNNGEHIFVAADRNIYIYTNLQPSTDLDDNTGLTETIHMPHKFMFTYNGQFQAPVVHCGKLLLTNALDVDYGGTGATTAAGARTNLGLKTLSTLSSVALGSNVTGTLPIANGGTGLSASPSMLTNLGSTTAANVLAASPRPGVTGTLGVANGGTGATVLSAITVGAATKASQDGSGKTITTTYAPLANPTFTGTVKAPNVSLSGAATIPTMTIGTQLTAAAITGSAVHTTTSKGDLGWSSNTTDGLQVITKNSLAYWNGQYQSGKSNLLYCSLGAFGTAATTAASTYSSLAGNNTLSGTNTFNKRVYLNERVMMTSGMAASSLGTINSWASAKDHAGTTYTPTGGIAWYWAQNSATGIFGFSRDTIGSTAHNILITTGEQLVLSAGERGGLDVFRYLNTENSVFHQAFDTKGKIHLVAEYGMEFVTGAASTPQRFSLYYDGSASMPGALTLGGALNLVQPLSIANGGTGATSADAARTALDVPQASKINSIWYAKWDSTMVDTATKVVNITDTGHDFKLRYGQMLIVYVDAATTSSSVTTNTSINVNNTGAKMVKYWGTSGGTNIPNNKWPKGIYMLIYAETCWRFISSGEHNYPNNA